MKRNLLFCAMFFALIAFSSNTNILASTKLTTEDFIYEVNEDGNTLTIVEGNRQITGAEYHVKGQVEIGGKVYRVTCIGENALSLVGTTKLYIDEGITEIKTGTSIEAKELVLPSTLNKLGYIAQAYRIEAISISTNNPHYLSEKNVIYTKDKKKVIQGRPAGKFILPEGVEEIGAYAFSYSYMTGIKFPKTLKKIETGAFTSCYYLSKIVMGKNVKEIGASAFSDCEKLKTVILKDKVEKIGVYAFQNCKLLKEVRLSKRLKTIGAEAFGETAILKLSVGKYAKKIEGIYSSMPSFRKLTIHKHNPYYKSIDNVIYSKDGKELISGRLARETVFVSKRVQKVSKSAFEGNQKVDGVVFEGKLEALPENCFAMSGVYFVVFPKTLKEIEAGCFKHCRYIEEMEIPKTVQYIFQDAFYGCGLKKLIVPQSVKLIGRNALHAAINKIEFKGVKPPKIREQEEIELWEYLEPEYEGSGVEPFGGLDLCIRDIVVPKKSLSKYKKTFKNKMLYESIKGK